MQNFKGVVMSVEMIKNHMNEHHANELKMLVKKYGDIECQNPVLQNVNSGGMEIKAGDKIVFVPFAGKVEESGYKDAIIQLCKNLSTDSKGILGDIHAFIDEFNSLTLATLSKDNEVCASYAPLLRFNNDFYIYISEVSEHFNNIKSHPNNVEIMLLEDESKAKSPIVRARLRYRVTCEFIERGELFDKVYDNFIARVGKGRGIDQIRNMLDFHLIKLNLGKGRFVKGFGQAYDIVGHTITPANTGMPHSMPHKKG